MFSVRFLQGRKKPMAPQTMAGKIHPQAQAAQRQPVDERQAAYIFAQHGAQTDQQCRTVDS